MGRQMMNSTLTPPLSSSLPSMIIPLGFWIVWRTCRILTKQSGVGRTVGATSAALAKMELYASTISVPQITIKWGLLPVE